MALTLHSSQQRIILHGVTWATFTRLLADRGDSGGVRLAYDQGTVELIMPSAEHEWYKGALTQIVDAIAFARDLHYENLASTTFTREDIGRGFEPDACFYIEHAVELHDVRHLDITIDPPPDLVLEIDITSPSLNKLPLYAALRVPEVWRYTRQGMVMYQLLGDDYIALETSVVLPGIRRADLEHFLAMSRTMSNRTAWFKAVVTVVQERGRDSTCEDGGA